MLPLWLPPSVVGVGRRLEAFDRAVVLVECEAGLANRLRTIAEQRRRHRQGTVSVLWLRNSACPGTFADVFQPPPADAAVSVVDVGSAEEAAAQRRRIAAREAVSSCNDPQFKALEARKRHGPKELVALYQSLFRLAPPLQRTVDDFDAAHGGLGRCVGVHLRTSDHADKATSLGAQDAASGCGPEQLQAIHTGYTAALVG